MANREIEPPAEALTRREGTRQRSVFRLVGTVVGIIVCADLLVGLLLADVNINRAADTFLDLAALSICTAVALWFVVVAPLRRDAMREREVTLRRELELLDDAQRQEFDARVHRAMEMAGTEAVAHRAVARALQRGTNRLSAELLLADSSEATLKRAAHAGPDDLAPRLPGHLAWGVSGDPPQPNPRLPLRRGH